MKMFEKGDTIRCIEARRSNGALMEGQVYDVAEDGTHLTNEHVRLIGVPMTWRSDRFEKVEPEPPKEDQDILVWAKVHDPSPKDDELVELRVRIRGGGMATAYTTDDTIVRPDAGQVPPWVKPLDCPSLHETAPRLLRRCQRVAGHDGQHVSFGDFWYDAGEAGRITGGGAS